MIHPRQKEKKQGEAILESGPGLSFSELDPSQGPPRAAELKEEENGPRRRGGKGAGQGGEAGRGTRVRTSIDDDRLRTPCMCSSGYEGRRVLWLFSSFWNSLHCPTARSARSACLTAWLKKLHISKQMKDPSFHLGGKEAEHAEGCA